MAATQRRPSVALGVRGWLIASLCFMIAASIVTALAYLRASRRNCLVRHPDWHSAKLDLEMYSTGALEFVNQPQALAGNRLDLSTWFGFQEVDYAKRLDLREVMFDVCLRPLAYLVFIFNKSDKGFCGIRLSVQSLDECILFTALPTGEFTSTTNLAPLDLRANRWSRVRVAFDSAAVSVQLDGRSVGRWMMPIESPQVFGFRGGERQALVDNVEIVSGDPARTIRESFFDVRGFLPFFLSGIAVALVATLFGAIVVRALTRRVVFAVILALMTLLLNVVVVTIFCTFVQQPSYVLPGPDREQAFLNGELATMRQRLKNYPAKSSDTRYRILFVGSSQTLGTGARKRTETFVAQIDSLINNGTQASYECINLGLAGFCAYQIAPSYHDFLALAPDLVVIDLSSNDRLGDMTQFRASIDSFVTQNQERGIRTLLVLEPNTTEAGWFELSSHEQMRAVAKAHGVPVVELHRYVHENRGRGLLWWDYVHPTSFGHKLIAECLTREIRNVMQAN